MRSHCAKDVHGIKQTLSNNASSPTLNKHTHMAETVYCYDMPLDGGTADD